MQLWSRLRDVFRPPVVWHQGLPLPARHLRFGGTHFRTEEHFLASGCAEVRRLVATCGLTAATRLLDVGCGVGRLAFGIIRELGTIERYEGVDVHVGAIAWCQGYLSRWYPCFRFTHLDVHNLRYNPAGSPISADFQLPFGDGSFDLVYLYSVFSHLTEPDVRQYLREFRRLLTAGGVVFLTAFLEEGVPSVSINPAGYRRDWQGALHCVRYERSHFEGLVTAAGLRTVRFEYGGETDGQSAVSLVVDH